MVNNPCSISWALWICEILYVKWDLNVCAEAEWASACSRRDKSVHDRLTEVWWMQVRGSLRDQGRVSGYMVWWTCGDVSAGGVLWDAHLVPSAVWCAQRPWASWGGWSARGYTLTSGNRISFQSTPAAKKAGMGVTSAQRHANSLTAHWVKSQVFKTVGNGTDLLFKWVYWMLPLHKVSFLV